MFAVAARRAPRPRPGRPLRCFAMAAVFEPVTADLRVRLLHPRRDPPRRAHEHDAGYDLACVEGFTLWPARRRTVGTGVAIALPPGVAGLVTPRSGLASRHGVTIVNAPGPRRSRLPRRAARHAPEHRRRAVRRARRGPDRPARRSCRSSCPTCRSSRPRRGARRPRRARRSGPPGADSRPGPDGDRPRTGRFRLGRSGGDSPPGRLVPYGVMVNASELVRPRSSRLRPGVTWTA